ncbi:MAG: transporter substrate-binding domain-containing protein, partial [Oscillospiraceae bacterium]|nr:transporter substrate-binding domain-containing protein [Oscillospiraceae bacterium]
MNIEVPNWRSDLYTKYYGAQDLNTELTAKEIELLKKLRSENAVVKVVLSPDTAPYSYYDDGKSLGITADIFKAAAERLELDYEFIPTKTKAEYIDILTSGSADIWLDCNSENPTIGETHYRTTEPYLKSSV